MLVCYFVPFIVSNRYLIFWVSNGHNSVTVQNRTHVYMNFSIPDLVIGIFHYRKPFGHTGPGVDSASNRNEYQGYLLGGVGKVKVAGA